MQERYLGDSHDFIKYALLRHLQRSLNLRIGVNWYFTLPEDVESASNNDGQMRHHLKNSGWRDLDSDLYDRIKRFDLLEVRQIQKVAEWEILKEGTQYFDDVVPIAGRQAWHQRAVSALSGSDLVFLDPDIGFEVKSMKPRSMPKYVLYREAADYLSAGKVVVCIQFARQCDPVERGRSVRKQLVAACGLASCLPIIRGLTSPNILFIALSPQSETEAVAQALLSFVGQSPKVEAVL